MNSAYTAIDSIKKLTDDDFLQDSHERTLNKRLDKYNGAVSSYETKFTELDKSLLDDGEVEEWNNQLSNVKSDQTHAIKRRELTNQHRKVQSTMYQVHQKTK